MRKNLKFFLYILKNNFVTKNIEIKNMFLLKYYKEFLYICFK